MKYWCDLFEKIFPIPRVKFRHKADKSFIWFLKEASTNIKRKDRANLNDTLPGQYIFFQSTFSHRKELFDFFYISLETANNILAQFLHMWLLKQKQTSLPPSKWVIIVEMHMGTAYNFINQHSFHLVFYMVNSTKQCIKTDIQLFMFPSGKQSLWSLTLARG